MKRVLCLMACFIFVVLGSTYGHELTKSEKWYVQPNQIAITEEGIFISMDDEWINADAIHRDHTGLYITKAEDEWSTKWECPKCHHSNSAWRNTCYNCGYRPPH